MGPVDVLVPKHHCLVQSRSAAGCICQGSPWSRPGRAFSSSSQHFIQKPQLQRQKFFLQRHHGRRSPGNSADRHSGVLHERDFWLAFGLLHHRLHRLVMGGSAQVVRHEPDQSKENHCGHGLSLQPQWVFQRKPGALADLPQIPSSMGLCVLPLLPEQLLLHPFVMAAHVFPRQFPRGQELDFQCGALAPHGSGHWSG